MRLSLSLKLLASNITLLALLVIAAGMMFFGAEQLKSQMDEAQKAADVVGEKVLTLEISTKEARFDIVQIQQWLTDVSATRGLDGLDDGWEEAKQARAGAEKSLSEVRALATELGAQDVVKGVDAVAAAIGPYYDTGVTMAHAYVDQGPAGGNKIMSDFDATAEKLSEALEALLADVDAIAETAHHTMDNELGKTDALAHQLSSTSLVIAVIGILVAIAVMVVMQRHVVKPLSTMTTALKHIGNGNPDTHVPATGSRKDEIAEMATALTILRDRTSENISLRKAQAEEQARSEEARRSALAGMAETVEQESRSAVSTVAEKASAMSSTAEAMSASARHVSENAENVAAAAQEALANAEAVAGATEELTASIREITGQITHARTLSTTAVENGRHARETIESLSQVVAQISDVANLIGEIASQTNLLALNATIEAARAGEAGKGFAVVASEVKNLANQTTRSTEVISQKISEIQSVTADAVSAVAQIGMAVDDMNTISTTIAAAMDQQSAATQEIARNVSETAEANREVARRITFVSQEAQSTDEKAGQLQSAASDVTDGVTTLRQTLVRVVRTATDDVDRRTHERHDVKEACSLTIGNTEQKAEIVNLSASGALLQGVKLVDGTVGKLRSAGYFSRPVTFRVVSSGEHGCSIRFDLNDEEQVSLARRLAA
ncbi:methyl-accepting chemotaxis protein [Radicibacter daui]|uniref:methyl-accepting chemotaxis protein n=1 Tax=Radicibacter daui TaxID=3064829 RepID=UPI004046C7E1